MTAIISPTGQLSTIVVDLNAQWLRLCSATESAPDVHALLDTLSGHPDLPPAPTPDTLDEVVTALRSDPLPYLAVLVRLAQSGQQVAARVIIQAFLPRMIRLSHRHPSLSFDEAMGECIGAMWELVMCHRSESQPTTTALAYGLLHHLYPRGKQAEYARGVRTAAALDTVGHDAPDAEPLWRPGYAEVAAGHLELLLEQATRDGVVSEDEVALVRRVYLDEVPRAAVAVAAGLRECTVRKRTSRTIQKLRKHAHHMGLVIA